MARPLPTFCLLVAAVLSSAYMPTALAWGTEGHALIADMAGMQLDPAARQGVKRLLALEDHDQLEQIASWADAQRHSHSQTSAWHYVDIPLSATHYLAARDCPGGRCVVHKLAQFARQLADSTASDTQRLRALKYVVHLAGDIQQPLHASDDHDKGGNDVRLTYFGRRTNLHQMWDTRILEQALGLHMRPHYEFNHVAVRQQARRLLDETTSTERQQWSASINDHALTPAAIRWADEAHQIAVQVAYGKLPGNRRGPWAVRYQATAWPEVRRQLQRGGVRLAAVLNAAFD